MPKYDCIILYNKCEGLREEERISELSVRDEVMAVEGSLKELNFNPYPLEIERIDKEVVSILLKLSVKFVFNLCEGLQERSELEMCVAALLEALGLPYTGSPPFTLGLALNKDKVKNVLLANQIPTPMYWVVKEGEEIDAGQIEFPVIVKPIHEDASLGITSESVVEGQSKLQERVELIHKMYRQPALVEQFIDGREINVSIIGSDLEVLPLSEIDFTNLPPQEPRIVSYQAKWNPDSLLYQSTVPVCPAKLASRTAARVKEIALQAFQQIGCRDYARVDIRLDKKNNPYVLEVNPNPDISPLAGLARSAKAAGLSYTELVARIVECALARSNKENKLAYA